MIRIATSDRVGTIDWVKGHPLPTDIHGYGIDAENVVSIEVTGESVQLVYKLFASNRQREVTEYNDDGLGFRKPDFIPEGIRFRLYGDLARTVIGNLRNVV